MIILKEIHGVYILLVNLDGILKVLCPFRLDL